VQLSAVVATLSEAPSRWHYAPAPIPQIRQLPGLVHSGTWHFRSDRMDLPQKILQKRCGFSPLGAGGIGAAPLTSRAPYTLRFSALHEGRPSRNRAAGPPSPALLDSLFSPIDRLGRLLLPREGPYPRR
jgi:hypothetical protein